MDWEGYLASKGRYGDTLLAHITPEEAMLLKRRGGSGTRNPKTGLMEFWDDGGNDPGGMGGTSGSTGFGGDDSGDPTSDIGTYGLTDESVSGAYGGWGSFSDQLTDKLANLSLMDYVKAAVQGVSFAGNLISGNVPGLMSQVASAFGIPSNPAMAMVNQVGKDVYGAIAGTPAQKEAAIQANAADFSLSGTKQGTSDWGSFDIASTPVGIEMQDNEKTLDKLFTEFGKVGDFNGAVQAAKTFESTAAVKTQLESAISKFSDDPVYQAIEPEFRTVADAALNQGMEPKVAADYAFKKVKEAYAARKFIKDYLSRKTKEVEDAA